MDDDTQPMEAIQEPWQVSQARYHEDGVGYGFVMLIGSKPKPWNAYLAPVGRVEVLNAWFASYEEALAAVEARAAESRAAKAEVTA